MVIVIAVSSFSDNASELGVSLPFAGLSPWQRLRDLPSTMDEQTLRALVREAVSRHLGAPAPAPGGRTFLIQPGHASHGRYVLPETDGPCLIEPTVMCNHCGYCQSHGH